MPDNLSYFSRHAEEYSAILERMAGSGNRELYNTLNTALKGLNDRIKRLTEGDTTPRLNGQELEALRRGFADTIKATEDYIEAVGDGGSGYVAREVARLLHKDAAVINRIPDNTALKLSDALYHARTSYVEVGDQKLGRVGGNFSSRIPLSYYDPSGQLRQGFFTQNYRIDDPAGVAKVFQARYPQYKEQLAILAADNEAVDTYMYLHKDLKGGKLKVTENPNNPLRAAYDPVVYDKCLEDRQFELVVREYMEQQVSLRWRDAGYMDSYLLQADRRTSVTDRNCAMSSVASLMGMDGILAKSERVVLVQNGHELEGCFMDTARGSDPARIRKEGPEQDTMMWQWIKQTAERDMKPQMTGNALRQLADLSVLDYLCGNVDRHINNFTYQFIKGEDGVVKLDGVMGIDNDNSFGKAVMVASGRSHNLGLPGLTAIPQSTADRIMNLTPEQLDYTLADYGLSLQEKEAAKERLLQLKANVYRANVIMDDPIPEDFRADVYGMCIIPDERFDQLKPEQLTHQGMTTGARGAARGYNIFGKLRTDSLIDTYVEVQEGKFVYDPNKAEQQLSYTSGRLVEPGPLAPEQLAQRFTDVAGFADNLYRNAWWNTGEFKQMRDALNALAGATELDRDTCVGYLETLQEKTDTYIRLKKDAPDTTRGRERLNFARRLRDLVSDVRFDLARGELAAGELPEMDRSVQIGDGDHFYGNETPLQTLERLQKTEQDNLINCVRANVPADQSIAKLMFYAQVKIKAEKNGTSADRFVTGMLQEEAVQSNVESLLPSAQEICEKMNRDAMLKVAEGANPGERFWNMAVGKAALDNRESARKNRQDEQNASEKQNDRSINNDGFNKEQGGMVFGG